GDQGVSTGELARLRLPGNSRRRLCRGRRLRGRRQLAKEGPASTRPRRGGSQGRPGPPPAVPAGKAFPRGVGPHGFTFRARWEQRARNVNRPLDATLTPRLDDLLGLDGNQLLNASHLRVHEEDVRDINFLPFGPRGRDVDVARAEAE